ncbi:uncharacterized protein J4E84_006611 [Alternaria hordeiaustralica]|uniref:uncharacterized protein n=1 Tax=Alternaria hordeiaustralica TaxID=1187925 RepID=UPI0020C26619|nr:uncharacterized protein J4E84_006611 [Alternaria hordeiaustralica]KAI4683773.1 hypothetical protein J4E84_006611 [Alternaria hordeiaustralica]KAI4704761.1 hypothetical protein J4E89_009638 [Alternaria sp. Ai002NY15]
MHVNTLIAMTMPLLAAGANIGHRHSHKHEKVNPRAMQTNVVIVTETIFMTVTLDSTSSSASSGCSITTVSTSLPEPSVTVEVPQKGIPDVASTSATSVTPSAAPSAPDGMYATLDSVANQAIIVNSCDYDVYVSSIGDDKQCDNSPGSDCVTVSANSTYSEPIRTCNGSGISLKVAKSTSMDNPMQFEYTVWDDKIQVSYDISYLDCMTKDGTNFDNCAGHEKGIQAAAKDGPSFECAANEPCAAEAYVVPEFGYLPDAPVGRATVDKGVAFEICAGNRS